MDSLVVIDCGGWLVCCLEKWPIIKTKQWYEKKKKTTSKLLPTTFTYTIAHNVHRCTDSY